MPVESAIRKPAAIVRIAHAGRASAALLSAAVALCGCSAVQSVADGVGSLSNRKADAVPERRAVAASATPVSTSAARMGSVSRSRAAAPTFAGDDFDAETPDFATDGGDGGSGRRTTVNAPLSVPDASMSAAVRRASLAVPGVYAPAKSSDADDFSEGASNLSQVSFAVEGGDYSPNVDRTGSFIVFASTQHRTTFDLYRKSVDGRTVTQITSDPSDDLMPAISPDGTRIAFASNRNGNWDIFTMPVGGGAATQITFDVDEEVQPTWAPDGKRLAFSRKNGRSGAWEIWIVDTTTPGLRTFVCEGFLPRWSPETGSDRLLFQRARQRGSRLYGIWTIDIVRGEGINPTEVLSARNAAILQPSWSPDGQQIVFTTVADPDSDFDWPDRSDIWVISADGTSRSALTNDQYRNMQPVWAADGRIYFVSNRSGIENVWAMTADRTTIEKNSAEIAAGRKVKGPQGSKPALAAAPSKRTPAPAPADEAETVETGTTANAPMTAPDFLKRDRVAGGIEE
jgi:TolB protein